MRNLIVEPGPKSPKVVFDVDKYHFELAGRSIPEDSVAFYKKIYAWLDKFGPELSGRVEFDFKLEYFNTSSSKCILDVFKRINNINKTNDNAEVAINWYVEEGDDDMVDTGEDYKALLSDIEFNIIEVDEL